MRTHNDNILTLEIAEKILASGDYDLLGDFTTIKDAAAERLCRHQGELYL